jgi:type IV pilus assembly protein PilP
MRARIVAAFALTGSSVALLICSACSTPVSTAVPAPSANTAAVASASSAALPTELKGVEYTENDFVESERNRDPFRSYLVQSQPVNKTALNQRKIELSQYSLDELKLVAIVTGGDQSRAMFVDPSGKGTVVYKGSFVCRPEVVHIGGSSGPEYQLNWRVDRIRAGDVVLIREDPAQPAIPPATRVIPLHPEAEKQAAAEGLLPG